MQAADLNHDGKLDLVIVNQKSNDIAVLLGNGDGSFQAPVTYGLGTGTTLPGCATVADFNNDGKLDIAVTNGLIGTSGGTISIFINQGNGAFFSAVQVPSTISPLCLTSADLNKDGNQDLWIGGNGSSAVLLGNGDGTFQTPQKYMIGLTGAGTYAVTVGDLNGDGLPDLLGVAVTDTSNQNSSLGVLLNQGNANFGPTPFGTVTLYPEGNAGDGIAFGDFNGDKKLDVAVTNSGSNDVTVLLCNGDGTLRALPSFPAGNTPGSIALADLAGTGQLYMILATGNAALDGNGVRVFSGNGDGTFKFYQGLATGSNPSYLTVGDFNGDGVPDLAVVDYASSVVSIILTQRPH